MTIAAAVSEAKVLPAEAREILRHAIRQKYPTEFDRTKAIEAAINRVKKLYPQHFRKD